MHCRGACARRLARLPTCAAAGGVRAHASVSRRNSLDSHRCVARCVVPRQSDLRRRSNFGQPLILRADADSAHSARSLLQRPAPPPSCRRVPPRLRRGRGALRASSTSPSAAEGAPPPPIAPSPASEKDLYAVLQVDRSASLAEVKAAYRRIVRRCHPDVNPSEEAKNEFEAVSKAYRVLSDPRLRGVYDSFGLRGVQAVLAGQPLQPLNRRPRWAGSPARGEDVRVMLQLALEDAVLGCNRAIEYEMQGYCTSCEGSGYHPHAETEDCGLCQGRGTISRKRVVRDGTAPTTVCACPDCGGSGTCVEQYCISCRGQGLSFDKRSIGVRIPPGISSGHWIKFKSRGSMGQYGGDSGDLYIGIQVHASIERFGSDLYSELKIPFTTAILGGAVIVTTIWEPNQKLVVPPCTQHGALLTIEGAGVPVMDKAGNASRGSHHFKAVVCLPNPELATAEELSLLRRILILQGKERQEARKKRR